jgi:hypothetical protein
MTRQSVQTQCMVTAMQSRNSQFDAAPLVVMLILVALAGLYVVSQVA